MASLPYLWKNRKKFPITSKGFFIAWAKRITTFKSLCLRNYRRSAMISKGATIAPTAEIGKAKISGHKRNLTIGEHTFIGNIEIALHEQVNIGNHVCINDGVILLTASHDLNDPLWQHKSNRIVVEDYAWIATNAIILPGVVIGKGAVVGAGAVVSKSVAAYDIVAGNPAKSVGKKRVQELNYNPCGFLAANKAWLNG